MKESLEGFLYPEINSINCLECGLCRKTCPILSPIETCDIPKVYAAWHLDDSVRTKSTSGGMFTAFAAYVIEQSGVVFGAVKRGIKVRHEYAETIDDIANMRGSKYFQSEIGDCYIKAKTFLDMGRKVMFTGTPCQIAGLRSFLGTRKSENVLFVEILCHGVPSGKIFAKYYSFLEEKYNIQDFRFRTYDGWDCCCCCQLPSGEWKRVHGAEDWYMKLFLGGYLFRESCYRCRFNKVPRCADVTIADFWGIGENEKYPFVGDTKKGCSLLLINSEKGAYVLNHIKNELFIEKRFLDEAVTENPNIVRPSARPKLRDGAYNYCFKHNSNQIELKYLYPTLYLKIRHVVYGFLCGHIRR